MFSRTAASLYRSCFPRGNAQRSRTVPKACWMASIGSIESLGIHRSRNDSALSFNFQRTQITANQGSSDETRLFKSVSIPGSLFLLVEVDGSGTCVTVCHISGAGWQHGGTRKLRAEVPAAASASARHVCTRLPSKSRKGRSNAS